MQSYTQDLETHPHTEARLRLVVRLDPDFARSARSDRLGAVRPQGSDRRDLSPKDGRPWLGRNRRPTELGFGLSSAPQVFLVVAEPADKYPARPAQSRTRLLRVPNRVAPPPPTTITHPTHQASSSVRANKSSERSGSERAFKRSDHRRTRPRRSANLRPPRRPAPCVQLCRLRSESSALADRAVVLVPALHPAERSCSWAPAASACASMPSASRLAAGPCSWRPPLLPRRPRHPRVDPCAEVGAPLVRTVQFRPHRQSLARGATDSKAGGGSAGRGSLTGEAVRAFQRQGESSRLCLLAAVTTRATWPRTRPSP